MYNTHPSSVLSYHRLLHPPPSSFLCLQDCLVHCFYCGKSGGKRPLDYLTGRQKGANRREEEDQGRRAREWEGPGEEERQDSVHEKALKTHSFTCYFKNSEKALKTHSFTCYFKNSDIYIKKV